MIKTENGILYRDIDDIIKKLYKPEQAKYLEAEEKDIINNVPNNLIYTWTSSRKSFYDGNITLKMVPKDYILTLLDIKDLNYKIDLLQNSTTAYEDISGATSDDEVSYFQKRIDAKERQLIKFKNMSEDDIINSPCFIWLYQDNYLVGIFTESPIQLLMTVLSCNIIYNCCKCDEYGLANTLLNSLPSSFCYDDKGNYYCPKCADKEKIIGADIKVVGKK